MGLFKFLKEKFKSKVNTSLEKYDKSLSKSRIAFSNKLEKLSKKYKSINEDYFDELEEILIEADCGVNFSLSIIKEVVEASKKSHVSSPVEINEILIQKMYERYTDNNFLKGEIDFNHKPEIALIVGVNGVGKTTSIAKLANYYSSNKKVLIVSADTFRAGAVEQLEEWSSRINCELFKGKDKEDPSSVVYDGILYGKNNNFDLIIIDTAGRLQNKQNLMDELGKINRVIHKEIDYEIETFLVLDATTGQNGIVQAKSFKELIGITGIIITKLDGTSKGGSVLSIKDELGIPVRFIGFGESINDLEVFDLEKFLYSLCDGLISNEWFRRI